MILGFELSPGMHKFGFVLYERKVFTPAPLNQNYSIVKNIKNELVFINLEKQHLSVTYQDI